jgi:hypothetical protein
MVEQHLTRRPGRVIRQTEGLDDRVLDEFRLPHRGQLHAPHPVARPGSGRRARREP